MDKPLDRNAALARMQASKRLKTSAFSQVALKALPGTARHSRNSWFAGFGAG
jgi:hypothetical protein